MAILTTFHFVLSVLYGYSSYYYVYGVRPPAELKAARESVYGPFKYLTYWDLLMQCGFFGLCFLSNVFSSAQGKRGKTRFEKVLDFLFLTIIFPTALFVGFTFWMLYAIDRELIFPVIYDSFFPSWLNHVVHTLPVVAVVIELICVQRTSPSKKKGFLSIYTFIAIYLFWVLYIAHTTGHWVYPILEKLSSPMRLVFYAALAFVMGICYMVARILHSVVWGKKSRPNKTDGRKKK